jgi:hypothetical protein
MIKTFIGTYIPDFNSIPSAVPEKKFLENQQPIRIFKVTWWPCGWVLWLPPQLKLVAMI